MDKVLPNVNVSLKALIEYVQDNNMVIKTNVNSNTNKKQHQNIDINYKKSPVLDHEKLMKSIMNNLNPNKDEQINRNRIKNKEDVGFNNSTPQNDDHMYDSTLSRLKLNEFSICVLVSIIGVVILTLLRFFKSILVKN